MFALAHCKGSTEADSYGWISKLLHDYHATVSIKSGTICCIPQGQLKNMRGSYKAPDFVNYICTAFSKISDTAYTCEKTIGSWWEVKAWISDDKPSINLFQSKFVDNFAQLQEQADRAFQISQLDIMHSIFSVGDYFAALEWINPNFKGDREWIWGTEQLKLIEQQANYDVQNAKLETFYTNAKKTLDENPHTKKKLKEWIDDYDDALEDTIMGNLRILYFGEKMFDQAADGSLIHFTQRFLHTLQWIYNLPHLKIIYKPSIFSPHGQIQDFPLQNMVNTTILAYSKPFD